MRLKIYLYGLLLFIVFPLCVVQASIRVMGGLTYEREASPGQTYDGAILLKNMSERIIEVKLYQTDYQFFCDGNNTYDEPGSLGRSNAAWIVFEPKRLTLSPLEDVAIQYTVYVPKEDTLCGSFWSMIMVEEVPMISPELLESEESVGISTVMRYGIQMITHIGESGERQLKFLTADLLMIEGARILQIDIENTGERWLRPIVWVEAYDEEGNYINKFEGKKLRTFPGTSIRQQIDISKLAVGSYRALVVADCGDDDIFGIQYTLKIDE